MKQKFEVKIILERTDESGQKYFEIVPDNKYHEKVKHCVTCDAVDFSIEQAKEILFNLLSEMFLNEFTDKFEL